MSILLYVGGSKDGEKGLVPYGFKRSMTMTEDGPEIYSERELSLEAVGKVRVMALDVSDPKSVEALQKSLADTPIDILINNAGISGPRERTDGIIPVAKWLEVFAVNSIAPVTVAAAFHGNLKKGHDKKLVTITSQLGSIAQHGGGAYPYHASKAAVNSFMHGLSKEWAKDGISVGIFHPGWVQTDMGGKGAPVTPEQSVRGLRSRIAELNAANSGSFRDYANKELPW